jgi:hypothetical protein
MASVIGAKGTDIAMRSKAELLKDLQSMLSDVLAAKAAGGSHDRIARAHGYVDGYMRALLDIGITTRTELLDIVAGVREKSNGPAVRVLGADDVAA